ncbi:MAG TPA: hypothetical protein VNT52_10260, partial [Acidimicrobiales bacterium]|nr:hypothetical protein [Acidimicrobiales bacterium]
MPGDVTVKGAEVAVELGGVVAGATAVRAAGASTVEGPEHGAAPGASKNRVKVTVPVGVGPPATPVTVAVSVTVAPGLAVPRGSAGFDDAARVS